MFGNVLVLASLVLSGLAAVCHLAWLPEAVLGAPAAKSVLQFLRSKYEPDEN